MGFARNMGRNCEPVADPGKPCAIENVPVAPGEWDHVRNLGPGKADAGQMACPVNRVGRAEAFAVEIVDPFGRIAGEPDRRLRRLPDIDMMGQREISEAKLTGDLPEQRGKLFLGPDPPKVPDEAVDPIEHCRTRAVSGPVARRSKPPAPGPSPIVSRRSVRFSSVACGKIRHGKTDRQEMLFPANFENIGE